MAFDADSLEITSPDELGRVIIRYNGNKLLIHCSHRNLVVMQNAWGRSEFLATAIDAMDHLDLDNLASMMSMCAYLNDSEERIHREEYLDLNIPLNHAITAMKTSWQVTWNGFEEPPQKEEDEEAGKKRNPLAKIFSKLFSRTR
jgi:hypothetical protein